MIHRTYLVVKQTFPEPKTKKEWFVNCLTVNEINEKLYNHVVAGPFETEEQATNKVNEMNALEEQIK